jgi:hypothetical protein
MPMDVVELRVHGISGMRAEEILDRPVVARVAGDQNAGFFRARAGYGDSAGPGGAVPEAYRWGNLTAGRAARTLLLLFLLPFMVSNLAVWMRPPTTRGWDRAVKALCHVLAATITAAFVLSIVGTSMDLVGWQCVPYHNCTVDRRYLGWLDLLPVGPRLAVLALIPLVAIRFVWWIGARSARSFEGFRRATEGLGQPDERAEDDRLDAGGFWHGEAVVDRLRSIHVSIALSVLDLSLVTALIARGRAVVGYALAAAVAVAVVAGVALLCQPSPIDSGSGWKRRTRALWIAVIILTAAALAYAVTSPAGRPVRGGLPGYADTVTGLILIQVAALAALVLAVVVGGRLGSVPARTVFQGLGTPVFGSIAVALAAIFSSALVDRVADFLDRGRIPSPTQAPPPGGAPLEPPISYRWAAFGGVVAVLIVTLIGLTRGRVNRSRQRAAAERVTQGDFPDAPPMAQTQLRAVRDAIIESRIPEQLAPFVVVYFVLSSLSLTFTALDLAGAGPNQVATRIGGRNSWLAGVTDYLTDVGTYSLGLLLFGVALFAVVAFRSAETRRIVGTLWDLGTFWPRAVHPFAPPCYAERAVPELARRLSFLTRDGDVVLSGHSQGSVLAAAAIMQLPRQTLQRVALLTYGSPLRRLYARFSPAYFGEDVLHEIGDRVDWRWRNLWRDTDPIGGPIFPGGGPPGGEPTHDEPTHHVDIRLRDPRGVTVEPSDTVPPPIERHWQYHTDPAYADAIRHLVQLYRR